jgi:hypothetical protein
MADGSFPTLISKDTLANAVDNPIWVELVDGAGAAIGVTGTSLDVNVTTSPVTITASDLDIRFLVQGSGNDNITVWANTGKTGLGTDYIPLVDADGNLQIDVLTLPSISFDTSYTDDDDFTVTTDKVTAVGMYYNDSSVGAITEGHIGIPRMTADRKQLMVIVSGDANDARRLAIDSSGNAKINIAAQGLTAVAISATSAANTMLNPIFVQKVAGAVSTTEVHDFAVENPTVGSPVEYNDYTVSNTFLWRSVIFSSSGSMKATILAGPIGSLVTKAVGFTPHQGGTYQMFFNPPIEVPSTSTGTARVEMRNREGATLSVYSTIIGNDV